MIDYNLSRIAREEYEQRVRSLVPVQEYDVRLSDDRQLSTSPIQAGVNNVPQEQSGWASKRVGQVLYAVGSVLASTGESIRQRGAYRLKADSRGKKSSVLG
jgi:hypothetical protein